MFSCFIYLSISISLQLAAAQYILYPSSSMPRMLNGFSIFITWPEGKNALQFAFSWDIFYCILSWVVGLWILFIKCKWLFTHVRSYGSVVGIYGLENFVKKFMPTINLTSFNFVLKNKNNASKQKRA